MYSWSTKGPFTFVCTSYIFNHRLHSFDWTHVQILFSHRNTCFKDFCKSTSKFFIGKTSILPDLSLLTHLLGICGWSEAVGKYDDKLFQGWVEVRKAGRRWSLLSGAAVNALYSNFIRLKTSRFSVSSCILTLMVWTSIKWTSASADQQPELERLRDPSDPEWTVRGPPNYLLLAKSISPQL